MPNTLEYLLSYVPLMGSVCQIGTALIAGIIGICTFRYTRRQSALALINQTNTLANNVNTILVQSPDARAVLGRLQNPVVGTADDAVLFMYLNYVHNTYRTFQVAAISCQVWLDTLRSCVELLRGLDRGQLERLLGRGYEAGFRTAVFARYDAVRAASHLQLVPEKLAA